MLTPGCLLNLASPFFQLVGRRTGDFLAELFMQLHDQLLVSPVLRYATAADAKLLFRLLGLFYFFLVDDKFRSTYWKWSNASADDSVFCLTV